MAFFFLNLDIWHPFVWVEKLTFIIINFYSSLKLLTLDWRQSNSMDIHAVNFAMIIFFGMTAKCHAHLLITFLVLYLLHLLTSFVFFFRTSVLVSVFVCRSALFLCSPEHIFLLHRSPLHLQNSIFPSFSPSRRALSNNNKKKKIYKKKSEERLSGRIALCRSVLLRHRNAWFLGCRCRFFGFFSALPLASLIGYAQIIP